MQRALRVALVGAVLGAAATAQDLAITGATVIDVRDRGRSTNDVEDAVVLIEDGVITAVGPSARVAIPDGFEKVDASGGFVVPGLVDAFAVLNNQSYANAFLYMGVTSILGVDGGRRGPMFTEAAPSPHIYTLESVGNVTSTTDELLARIDELAGDGVSVLLLMYQLTPDQVRAAAQRARELGLATIGELARTTYREALDCGVDAFVHTTRYSLDLAPRAMAAGIAEQAFSDELDSPKWRYYRWLSTANPTDPSVRDYARDLAAGSVSLIPTSSLLHLHRPNAVNPWTFEVAKILDPADVNMPADRETGVQAWSPDQRRAYGALAANTDRIEQVFRSAGCRYVAGSGTDVWGTMPGISLHTELAFLSRLGLTPREVLAAATSNPAETFRWDEVGHVRPGCRGDLLLLDADPRTDVSNLRRIRSIVRNGAVLARDRLIHTTEGDGDR